MMLETISIYQKYVRVNASLDVRSIDPFVKPAIEKYLLDYIPESMITAIDELDDSEGTTPDEKLLALKPYVERCIATFALFLASPSLDLTVTEGGFTINEGKETAPASAQRVQKYTDALEVSGWNAVESMLRFLEAFKDNYTDWKNSDCYTLATLNLINSAVEFDKIIPIDKSRLQFVKLRPTINKVEQLHIIPVISQELYDVLKANEGLSDKKVALLKKIKHALVYFTASEAMNLEKYIGDANMFLSQVKEEIDINPDDYEEYKNSSIYTGTRTQEFKTAETADSKVITFGVPRRK